MRKLCSLRTKIISAMVGLTLLTAIVVGGISVVKSSIVVSDSAKEMLLISSKNKSNELYNDIKQIEKSVNLIGSFVSSTSSMQSLNDMNKLKDRKFGESEYSKIRIYPKELGKNTKWAKSAYFYFNQNYIPSYDGAWYVENNGNFIRELSNSEITPEDGDWYFKPVEEKKEYGQNLMKILISSYQ